MNSSRNTVLQLSPPKIDLQTKDIVGAQIGVPLHAVIIYPPELVFKRARVSIDPPLAGTVEEHDDVRLWATLDPALVGAVTEPDLSDSTRAPLLLDATTIKADVNATIELHIKESQFLTDVVVYLFYTIERNSENLGTSLPLSYIYNRIRPGIKDDLTVPGGHSKLKLLLPDEIKNGVGPGFTTARVAVQYPYARAYDRISFMCNGKILEVSVGPTEAPEPPDHGSETPTTLYFDVDRAFLELAKQQDHRMAFLFTVYDQLNNSADPDAQWSKPQFVDEDLDGTRLAKPVLREQLNDPGDTPEIDLGKLKDKPLLIVVATMDPRFVTGYKVTTFYTATHPDHPDVFDEQSSTVTEDEFEQKQLVVIEVPNHKVSVPGSTVNVFYELRKPDNADGSPGALVGISNTASALVVGAALELKPPSVLQANGATLAPLDALTQLTIVVPPGSTRPTDLLSVSWTAKPGTHEEGSITTPPRPISEIGLNIPIAPALMAYCLGDQITVSYSITRDGIPLPSETLTLNVQNLPQSVLPAPRLKQAADAGEGAELRLSDLTPEGKMWFSGFPLNIAGQFVWLLFKGTNADGSAYEKYIWAAPFAFVNDDWVKNGYFEATAPYVDLKGLKDGTPLTMEMWVAFGKSEDLGLAKQFVVRTYTVSAVQVVVPAITSVKGTSSNEEILHGGLTVETDITLTGTATPSTKIDLVNGSETISDDEIPVDSRGIWTAQLSGLVAGNTYNLAAKRKDGAISDRHDVVVVELMNPTLTNVLDHKGIEVPDDETTFSTTLKLKGTASQGQQVEVFDGREPNAESMGIATAHSMRETWDLDIEVKEGAHRLYAKSLYHSTPVHSNVRNLTTLLAPTGENFDAQPNSTILPGRSKDIGSMIITNVSDTNWIQIGPPNFSYPGKIEKQTLISNGKLRTIEITLRTNYSSIEFWYVDVNYGNSAEVIFYSSSLELGKKPLLPSSENQEPLKMFFESKEINRIVINSVTDDVIYFDTFTFRL
ncbi:MULTISPECIES: hypothetical protein [unclassified Pseudomonas]|uniref:hypothetical protein n=1 Tax=unclassified Pseudomonas TaxID=196821 RepID=UPI001F56B134|nr:MULTISPECIES: hypothetical protein [unclassified Pseudomonas]